MEYVEKANVSSTDPGVLRLLQDVVASAPRMPSVQFDQMFNSQARPAAACPLRESGLRPSPRHPWQRRGSPLPPHDVAPLCALPPQVQDMLVVVYLANLTRTQLALAEKLQSVALAGANNGV